MKAVLLSIKPKYCELIASGKKTIEVRKTKPKLKPPFKCYIYQTKDKQYCTELRAIKELDHALSIEENAGKVIGEFICDRIEEFESEFYDDDTVMNGIYRVVEDEDYPGERIITRIASNEEDSENFWICTLSCLSFDEIKKYIGWDKREKTFYGGHISNLKIYAEPKELSEFYYPPDKYCEKNLCGGCPYDEATIEGEIMYGCEGKRPLIRPPQSWCYIEINK